VGDSGVGKTALTNLICHGAGLLNPGNIYFIVDVGGRLSFLWANTQREMMYKMQYNSTSIE
jgi:hypothetical protein